MPVLDCASLVIFKAFFDRTKDWADIEAVAVATPEDVEAAARAPWAALVGRRTTRRTYHFSGRIDAQESRR